MLIDILYLIIVLIAVYRGLKQGFIVGVFSLLAFIVGLAAALKLSVTAAHWLEGTTNISARWLPVLSFILVFIAVVFLVRIIAAILEKAVEALMLGMLNKIGGALMYIFLYTVIFSIILFYSLQLNIFKEETITESVIFPWIAPLGPWIIDSLGDIIPFFRNMFTELQHFFEKFSDEAPGRQTVMNLL